jgi:tRNA(adenine34) deaminase
MIRKRRTDEEYMKLALREAREAAERGEVPIGAVAVDETGRVLARAHNQVEMLKDATAHAEMIALTQAAAGIGDWRLNEVTLYVTKEPCMMCAGAMVNCRLGRLVYGCPDPRCGAAGSALSLLDVPGMLHRVPCEGGVCAAEALALIQQFFQGRRRAAAHQKADVEGWLENWSMN